MRLAISNIAWDITEDSTICRLLQNLGIDAIDIAPGKYFPDPNIADDNAIARVRNWWSEQGINITGMQALLFGTTNLNIFSPLVVQKAMLKHLGEICRIGSGLGAKQLVFGSPKNRDRAGFSDKETEDKAVDFFSRLGDIARAWDVIICLEPNPACYGANFMLNTDETAKIVKKVAHQSIMMQLDTGALTINGEDPLHLLEDHASIIGHIHASEPSLLPLSGARTDHESVANALWNYLPDHIVSVEMLPTQNEAHDASISRALKHAIHHYRHPRFGPQA